MSRSALIFEPDELDALHECLLANEVVEVDDELRIVVEENWPELIGKLLPPRHQLH
jgi:hypothetical protein